MKEMIYSKERKIEVLDTGYCYELLYYIISLGTHPCAYVKIPVTHWLYGISDYDEMPIECHYGLTYCRDYLMLSEDEKVEGKFIGWDYAHAGDYAPWYDEIGHFSNEHKWTTEEIQKEVKDVCYQIIKLENESPADKTLRKNGWAKKEFEKSIEYKKTNEGSYEDMIICFDKEYKGVSIDSYLETQELKAVVRKCKELRVVR